LLSTPISSRLNELECCIRIADDFNEALAGTRAQTALARKSGVAQSTIGRILRGDVSPNAETLVRLAHAFRTPIATFIAMTQDDNDDDAVRQEHLANLNRANWADGPNKHKSR
jgi:transcriptional regulator with XRE-family HTH domain